MNDLWENLCDALKDAKNCAFESLCSFAQSLDDLNKISEMQQKVEVICGKDVAKCFHEDALRIAETRQEKVIDVYKKLADECIKMCLEGKPEGEIIWYFTQLER